MRGIVFLIPPAHPGNFGDMLCVKSILKLAQGRKVVLIDIFAGLESSMQEWKDFGDLTVINATDLRSKSLDFSTAKIVILGQDTMDSRYGDFHLLRMLEVIDYLNSQLKKTNLAIWNISLSEKFILSDTSLKLFRMADSIVFRDEITKPVLSLYNINNGIRAFDLSSVAFAKKKKLPFSTKKIQESSCIGLALGNQIEDKSKTIIGLIKKGLIPKPNRVFEFDQRKYSMIKSDLEVGASLMNQVKLPFLLNPNEILDNLDHTIDSMISQLQMSQFLITSRYHVSLACLYLGIPFVVFTYNEKYLILSETFRAEIVGNYDNLTVLEFKHSKVNRYRFKQKTMTWQKIGRSFFRNE
jgi:polysaccharide pyruvyl transferase WcaK-like protein